MTSKYLIASYDDKREFIFTSSIMSKKDWDECLNDMGRLLLMENNEWEFNLQKLDSCTPPDLGMWIIAHAMVKKYGKNLSFKVEKDSNVFELLKTAKLDNIFSITKV